MQFKLTEANGKVIENSGKPAVYLHGGYGNTLPKIEEALDGQEAGYALPTKFRIPPWRLIDLPKSEWPLGANS
jgi:FKBP-type peptidyl-prolyl cis-trans isomerase 2